MTSYVGARGSSAPTGSTNYRDELDTDLGRSPAQRRPGPAHRPRPVLLANPHTLVLDEATALLDPSAARHTERALAATVQGRTVIAVAHRLHTARDADRIAVMEAGRITELGDHHELSTADGAYAALWRSLERRRHGRLRRVASA